MNNRFLLNFIMKNESANLPRMLAALEPHIIGAAVTDTGSTDGSMDLVRRFFEERYKPVWFSEVPFEDYSQARNAGLRLARSVPIPYDYILLCDPDMELVVDGPIPKLDAPIYALLQDNGYVRYWNIRLLRHDTTNEYVGLTHEVLSVPENEPPVAIGGMWYKDHQTGANRPEKYSRDIALLKKSLLEDPLNPRSVFYMIQSLHGIGALEEARKFCDLRVQMGGLGEEVWWTKMQMARFDEALERDPAQIEHEYMEAYHFRPTRCESLFGLAVWHRKRGAYHAALIFAREAALMSLPPLDVLSIESAIYEWMACDEWLCVALLCKAVNDAKYAAHKLMTRKIPADELARIRGNVEIALGAKAAKKFDALHPKEMK